MPRLRQMDVGAIEKRGSTRGLGDFFLRYAIDAHPPTLFNRFRALQTMKVLTARKVTMSIVILELTDHWHRTHGGVVLLS